MEARKFSDAQVQVLEIEFNSGLNSTSLKKFGKKISELSTKLHVEKSDIQVWINNRKRGPPPTCFPMAMEPENKKSKKEIRVPSLQRRPSGYNLFSGHLFSTELRGKDTCEKNEIVSRRWKEIGDDGKEKWNEMAKTMSKPSVDNLTDIQQKKLIDVSLKRIDMEMQNITQYGGRGVAMIIRPYDKKLVISATSSDENFLVGNRDILTRFSSFATNVNSLEEASIKSIQSLLNEKYKESFDKVSVEYSKYGTKFSVEGWPSAIPFRQPNKYGKMQLQRIWEHRDSIKFLPMMNVEYATRSSAENPVMVVEKNSTNDESDAQLPITAIVEEPEKEIAGAENQRAKRKSFVSKGDIVPVLSPEQETIKFWLFLCSSKCKTNGTLNGKWLDRIGESLEYRLLPIKASTQEKCVLWNNLKGCREVLPKDSFTVRDDKNGIFVISPAAHEFLERISAGQFQ